MEQIDEKTSHDETGTEQRYFIDLEWYRNNSRSFNVLVQNRMCSTSFKGWNVGVSEDSPSDASTTPRSADAIAEIQRCCSKKAEFTNPNLTVMEILFRILLSAGNQPLTMEEIQSRLNEWTGGWDGRVLNEDVLKRLIEADNFYGIKPVPSAA